MVSRRFVLRGMVLGFGFALTAVGGWAVRPYLPGPARPEPAAETTPETTEELFARIEELRAQKRDLIRQEREIAVQKAEFDRQEATLVSELRKLEEKNQWRLYNLGHRENPGLARR